MKKLKDSPFLMTVLIVLILSAIIDLAAIVLGTFDYYLINDTVYRVSSIITVIAGEILVIAFMCKKRMQWYKNVLLILLLIAILYVFYIFYIFASLFETREYEVFTSPDGKNQIIAIEGGFLDAVYTAYPVKNDIFYFKNNDSIVKRHDHWGGAKKEIEWKDSSAVVYFILEGNERSDEYKIEVSYN
jgi:Ca2+/Na+ antiporter